MRVFVTGASGLIGSSVVPELLAAGHQVLALARSDASATALRAAGVEVQRGSLEDLESLRSGAASAEGVIHLAFSHDFTRFEETTRMDQRAIETLGAALEGSGRPLVVASGTVGLAPGRVGTERDEPEPHPVLGLRAAGARSALAFSARGVRSSIVRLAPTVHGPNDWGFVPGLIGIAREKGVSGYIGDGQQRWPAIHVRDAARLFRLALEKAPAGSVLHGVAEEGVPLRTLAEVIGRKLNVPTVSVAPEEAGGHFGWLTVFLGLDSPISSARTRELLDWRPTHPTLIEDLDTGPYFQRPAA